MLPKGRTNRKRKTKKRKKVSKPRTIKAYSAIHRYNVGDLVHICMDDSIISVNVKKVVISKTKYGTEINYRCTDGMDYDEKQITPTFKDAVIERKKAIAKEEE